MSKREISLSRLVKTGICLLGVMTAGKGGLAQAKPTEVVLSGCGNELLFADAKDVGTYPTPGGGTCIVGNGQVIDLCSGKITHQFNPSVFKQIENSQQKIVQPGFYTLKKGKQSKFANSCDHEFILKKDVQFELKKPTEARHLQLTGKGQMINSRTGEVIVSLTKKEYALQKKTPAPSTRLEL